jgi:hypothetical protein
VNPKGEMKGSAITGPVGKEAADLWPVSFYVILFCIVLGCADSSIYSVSHPTLVW